MDLSGWNHLTRHVVAGPFISASQITGRDRVLLRGYDVHRNDFQVELTENGTQIAVTHGEQFDSGEKWPVEMLYPNKRVYARKTDLSFAILLKESGGTPTYIDLPTENEV